MKYNNTASEIENGDTIELYYSEHNSAKLPSTDW